mmetsp:Transcript_21827/g.45410  ORF Transcript_21827/g.45410 Transcript_21827/m.45410 type:complete len:331 (+) Transcript_21827:200-1192(+)
MIGNNGNQLDSVSIFPTLFMFAVISWVVYRFIMHQNPTRAAPSPDASTRVTGSMEGATRASNVPSANNDNRSLSAEWGDCYSYGNSRHPPHLVPPEGWAENGSPVSLSGCLIQGVIPFRSTLASCYESRLKNKVNAVSNNTHLENSGAGDTDSIAVNRRERARLFARLFSDHMNGGRSTSSSEKMKPPPNRGANIVVTIRYTDVKCKKIHKILFLLGTYYNLFVLVDISGSSCGDKIERKKNYAYEVRGELLKSDEISNGGNKFLLSSQILPLHRIVLSSTVAGRVAFVRQMHGVEMVVDSEEKVATELKRFGFRVLLYPTSSFESEEGS